MLILASSSVSRSNLLKETKIEFQQISFDYDENLDKNLKPSIYVQKIVLEKERQFCTTYEEKFKDETLLFADSIVCIGDKILTKANTKEEAYEMLGLQDGKYASILSAFLLKNLKKEFSLFQKQRFIFQNLILVI